jgi:hypothetical protein
VSGGALFAETLVRAMLGGDGTLMRLQPPEYH